MRKTKEINKTNGKPVGASSARPLLQMLTHNNGITLIALVITIVIMLIIASVTVNVAINGGLFEYAGKAKNSTEVKNEKETVQSAAIIAEGKSKTGRITVQEMQNAINKVINEGTATAIDNGDTIAVKFDDSNRYYYVDNKGKVEGPVEIVFDTEAGVLDGTGTETDPFVIMSIEDLVYFSQQVNSGNSYEGQYIELGKTLDFNSDLSYENINTTEYDTYLGGDGETGLKEQLTNGLGFRPIGYTTSYIFRGVFDGNNNEIKNIKIDVEGYAGLFGVIRSATIKNLGVQGNVTATTDKPAGGIVGYILDTGAAQFKDCYVKVNVTSVSGCAGGLVGSRYMGSLLIENCQNLGNITGYTLYGSGGMIGCVSSSNTIVRNSCNYGIITLTSGGQHNGVGGIVGSNMGSSNLTIENCYNHENLKTSYEMKYNLRSRRNIRILKFYRIIINKKFNKLWTNRSNRAKYWRDNWESTR